MNKQPFESIDKISKMYKDGMTQVEIAELYGVTQALVSYHLLRAGVAIRKNKFHPTAIQNAKSKHVKGINHWAFHDIPVITLIEKYLSGISTAILATQYHSSAVTIQRKLKDAGVVMRRKGFGTWQTAKDGHSVQSYYELLVDDWLFEHGIQHITQPPLPFGKNSRSDFLVGDLYIEVMGLISSPIYRERYSKKLDLYKKHGLKFICVYPSHFRNNLKILEKHLQ